VEQRIEVFDGKVLLVTGGTGSFGTAVIERFLHTAIAEIRVFSRDEKKQDELRHRYRSSKLKFYLGDVRDPDSILAAMRGVHFVFAAAALKQVPSCEFYPLEAVRTNVLGAANTIDAAISQGVERVVMLSTDKAVYPINAMGMSKALMEKIMVAKSRNLDPGHTLLCCTRYGNVMASRGSVIPLFIEQIKSGADITVTDPNMTRFMMSLPDAIDLVLFAMQHAEQGDTFVQKAPAATIGDLAAALKAMFASKSNIKVIGTRHGEKLYESLLSKEEAARAIDLGRYYRVPADTRDLNYGKFFDEGDRQLGVAEEYTSHNTERLTIDQLQALLASLDYVRAELGIR
jgi:UDP-glucose 4-epimerase